MRSASPTARNYCAKRGEEEAAAATGDTDRTLQRIVRCKMLQNVAGF